MPKKTSKQLNREIIEALHQKEPSRSAVTRRLIEKAQALMRGFKAGSLPMKSRWTAIKKLDKQLHDQINKAGGLSDVDPFWMRWGYFVEQHSEAQSARSRAKS